MLSSSDSSTLSVSLAILSLSSLFFLCFIHVGRCCEHMPLTATCRDMVSTKQFRVLAEVVLLQDAGAVVSDVVADHDALPGRVAERNQVAVRVGLAEQPRR